MRRLAVLGCLLLLATPAAASAEWQFTPMIGVTFLGSTTFVAGNLAPTSLTDAHVSIGGSVMLIGGGIFGVEGIGAFTPHFFGANSLVQGSHATALMGNIVVSTPRRLTEYTLRPIVSAGFGAIQASVTDAAAVFPLHSTLAGFDVGGGAVGFLTRHTGVRLDVRYYTTLGTAGNNVTTLGGAVHLHYVAASVGVVIRR